MFSFRSGIRIVLSATLGTLAAPLIGCSGTDTEVQPNFSEDEVRANPGQAGGFCGGVAGIRCRTEGYSCKLSSAHPDASGVCVAEAPKPGQPGGLCGGLAGIACRVDGYTCKLDGNHPDANGTCEKPAPGTAGGLCGGIAGIACREAGYTCKLEADHPDATGTCHKPAPGTAGGFCGGVTGIPCRDAGYACKLDGNHPDASGACEERQVQCQAIPTCAVNETQLPEGQTCGFAQSCHPVTLCGRTIVCASH